VSWHHKEAVRDVQCRGGPHSKAILKAMADAACEFCSLCWPGVKCLARENMIGQTRIREALEELATDGYLKIHAYPHGGRGRTTEYIVTMRVGEDVQAPCAKCRENKESHRPAVGMTKTKHTGRRWVSAKPTGLDGENPPRSGAQYPVETEYPPRARAREDEDEDSASPRITVDTSTKPHSSPEAARAAEEFMRQLTREAPDK
jgi:hypothetical protein